MCLRTACAAEPMWLRRSYLTRRMGGLHAWRMAGGWAWSGTSHHLLAGAGRSMQTRLLRPAQRRLLVLARHVAAPGVAGAVENFTGKMVVVTVRPTTVSQ